MQIIKLLDMQFSSVFSYFIPLRYSRGKVSCPYKIRSKNTVVYNFVFTVLNFFVKNPSQHNN
jgi:hypothetical protein